jgi:hypothetical protein
MWLAGGQQNNTNVLAYSSDGIVWRPVENFTILTSVNSVAWNGSIWIAVGASDTDRIMAASKDGIIWYDSDTTSGSPLKDLLIDGVAVIWSGLRWFVSGSGASTDVRIVSSTDGINWVASYSNISSSIIGLLANNGPYLLGVENYGTIVISDNEGNTWTQLTPPPTIFADCIIVDIRWNGSMWVIAANKNSTIEGIIAYNFDSGGGLNRTFPDYGWTVAYTFTQGAAFSVAWNGSSWYASGSENDESIVISSQDGITWTPITNNPSSSVTRITSRRPLPYVGAVPGRGGIASITTTNDTTGLNQVYYNLATSQFYIYVP